MERTLTCCYLDGQMLTAESESVEEELCLDQAHFVVRDAARVMSRTVSLNPSLTRGRHFRIVLS